MDHTGVQDVPQSGKPAVAREEAHVMWLVVAPIDKDQRDSRGDEPEGP